MLHSARPKGGVWEVQKLTLTQSRSEDEKHFWKLREIWVLKKRCRTFHRTLKILNSETMNSEIILHPSLRPPLGLGGCKTFLWILKFKFLHEEKTNLVRVICYDNSRFWPILAIHLLKTSPVFHFVFSESYIVGMPFSLFSARKSALYCTFRRFRAWVWSLCTTIRRIF